MSVIVISVPETSRLFPERLHDQFDTSGSVGDEDKIKRVGVSLEEAERSQSNILDMAHGELR